MNNVLVKLENVSKSFGKTKVIKTINLDIYEGEFLTLLGPSGCGKTTVLRMISGLETVSSGKVYIDGKNVTNVDPTKREVNTIFQNLALFPHKTVFENIAFGLEMKHMPKDEIKSKVDSVINLVNLKGFENRYPRELSGGQQQRVAIARGVIMNPKVLLLDESLCSLDLKLKRKMQVELKKIQRKLGITFIYVTHDQNEAITMSDRIVIINNGIIEQMGTPKEIYTNPVSVFAADFIGESNIFDGVVDKVNDGSILACVNNSNMILEVTTDEKYKKGDKIKIITRPENIVVHKNHVDGSFEGIIDELIFMGDYSKLHIKIDDIIFKADVLDIDLYQRNDKVHVKFNKNNIIVIRDNKDEK